MGAFLAANNFVGTADIINIRTNGLGDCANIGEIGESKRSVLGQVGQMRTVYFRILDCSGFWEIIIPINVYNKTN